MTLLTEFKSFLTSQGYKSAPSLTRKRFQGITKWFEQNITDLNQQDLDLAIAPRWQSVQTEIKREFKLLTTDVLFLSTAKEEETQIKRIDSISVRLAKLISYCQIMLNKSN